MEVGEESLSGIFGHFPTSATPFIQSQTLLLITSPLSIRPSPDIKGLVPKSSFYVASESAVDREAKSLSAQSLSGPRYFAFSPSLSGFNHEKNVLDLLFQDPLKNTCVSERLRPHCIGPLHVFTVRW